MKNNIFKIFLPALALVFFASCGGSEKPRTRSSRAGL